MRVFTVTFNDSTLVSIFSTYFNTSLIKYRLYLQGTQISELNSSLVKVFGVDVDCSLSSFLLQGRFGLGTDDL